VFQHYALFRHMTVFENVAFGLRVRPRATRPSKEKIRERVERLLRLVQLKGLAERYPAQLSGGQRQRVALARSLAIEPSILLLDEPFGALDAQVRKELRRWLRDLHDRLGLTTVFVTHDQEEALELADQVVVMNLGKIEQIGPPQVVYDRPATAFVYGFLGNANRLPVRVVEGRVVFEGHELGPAVNGQPRDGEAVLFIRPHDFDVLPNGSPVGIAARVRGTTIAGPLLRMDVQTLGSGLELEVELARDGPGQNVPGPGETVQLVPRRHGLFPPQ
jgi:sulfate transport system ATP-binding protein